jgi:AraC-like DNA-binding protein
MFTYEIIEGNGEVILQYTPVAFWRQLYPNGSRQAIDQAMAGTLNVFYLLSGKRIQPKASRKNRLIFDRKQLLAPVLHHDQSLFRVFESLVRKKGQKSTFAGHVKDIILTDFKGQTPPIEVVASKLNITVRSLQRRFSSENTSFRQISLQITKEMGRRLLAADHKTADVARILGYSSPRAFRRAFKSR